MLTKDDLLSLRAKQGKLIRVILNESLYLTGEDEQLRLWKPAETDRIGMIKLGIDRIATIKEAIGYLTRYSLSETGGYRWLKINPFGKEGPMIIEDGVRAGDIEIRLSDIRRLEIIAAPASYRV